MDRLTSTPIVVGFVLLLALSVAVGAMGTVLWLRRTPRRALPMVGQSDEEAPLALDLTTEVDETLKRLQADTRYSHLPPDVLRRGAKEIARFGLHFMGQNPTQARRKPTPP